MISGSVPEKRARTLTADNSPSMETNYTKIEVPVGLVDPLKELISKLCYRIQSSEERDTSKLFELLDTNNASANYRGECDAAIELFKATRSKLFSILEKFSDDVLDGNLPNEKYIKFKQIRKLYTDWFRLGVLTLKREENPINDSNDIIKHNVFINSACDSKELRLKIFRDLEERKIGLEKEARIVSFQLLNKFSNEILIDIDNIDVHDGVLFAKAFRSVLRSGPRSYISKTRKPRSVSFSSDQDLVNSPNTEANTKLNERRPQSRSPYRADSYLRTFNGHVSRRQFSDNSYNSSRGNQRNFNAVHSSSFRKF
jgi:hypothetical protein